MHVSKTNQRTFQKGEKMNWLIKNVIHKQTEKGQSWVQVLDTELYGRHVTPFLIGVENIDKCFKSL